LRFINADEIARELDLEAYEAAAVATRFASRSLSRGRASCLKLSCRILPVRRSPF
jgi:hypothetical protein